MNTSEPRNWKYLEPRPKSFYRQLFIKGSRIRAEVIYGLHANAEEPLAPEEIANQYEVPLEAVREAIAYCESNPPEVETDFLREETLMEASGMKDADYKYHGKPKVLAPQEMARIRRL
jgi:uncharacterized protein (DUF433 family)